MVLPQGSFQHGHPIVSGRAATASPPSRFHGYAPFARVGRTATSFPTVIAHMRPSDSQSPLGLGSGSPRHRPTSRRMSSSSRVAVCTLKTPRPSEFRSRDSVDRICHEETAGSPRLLGRPLHTCHGHFLPRRPYRPHRPIAVAILLPSGPSKPWALPGLSFRWLSHHGPHARLPTHQRRHYWRRCKAGYRPAGLSFDRAGFAPAGRRFRISGWHRHPSLPD